MSDEQVPGPEKTGGQRGSDDGIPDDRMSEEQRRFLAWKGATKDSVDNKRTYIRMTGHALSSILLAQILFLSTPNRSGVRRREIVERDGAEWIAIPRSDWWGQASLTERQFDRCCARLVGLGLIATEVHEFRRGRKCVGVRIDWPAFLEALGRASGKDEAATPTRRRGQKPDPPHTPRKPRERVSQAPVAEFGHSEGGAGGRTPLADDPPQPAVTPGDPARANYQNGDMQVTNLATPNTRETLKRESESESGTLNVSGGVNFVAGEDRTGPLWGRVRRVVEELRDYGSERRHAQLLGICERNGLDHLPAEALRQTRNRQAQEGRLGALEKPARYYDRALVRLLAAKQVHVPTVADAAEQRAAMRVELGLPLQATDEEVRAAIRAGMSG